MKNSRNQWILILILLSTVFGFFRNTKLHASTVSFGLQQRSNAYWIQDGNSKPIPNINESTELPYGSKVGIEFIIKNANGKVQVNISVRLKEALQHYEYYSGVLKINGVNASDAQYQAFINNEGLKMELGNYESSIYIEVMTIGSQHNKIATDLDIYSSEVNYGLNRIVCEHAFRGYFSSLKTYTIRFFGRFEELLSVQTIKENEKAIVPEVSLTGYNMIGFNSKRDGQGMFYNPNIGVQENQDYYAVFDIMKFNVNYYVDGELFTTRVVNYGNDAEELIPQSKKNNKFIKWDKDLTSIKSDLDVYAVFEKDKVGRANFKLKHSMSGNDKIEKEKNFMIAFSLDDTVNEKKHIKEIVYMNHERDKDYYICLVVVAIGLSNVLFTLLTPNIKKE